MFTNINYVSKNDSYSINVCNVQENSAWVLDGANPLFPTNICPDTSDGEWFIHQVSAYLKQHIHEAFDLKTLMKQALEEVHKNYLKLPKAHEMYDVNMPSACCALVLVKDNMLSYFVLGNCEILANYKDKEMISISDLSLQKLDAKLLEIAQTAKQERRMNYLQARKFMDQMMIENRLRRNMRDGYYVLGEDSNVVEHALQGSIPLQNLENLTLICNGFSQYLHCKKVVDNFDQYIYQNRDLSFVEIYENMLQKQKENKELAKYMQEKISTKTTVVFFDVTQNRYLEDVNNESQL